MYSGLVALGQSSQGPAAQRAFLQKYCVGCHNDKLRTAGLSLANVNLTDVTQSGETLEKVVRKVSSGAMPPAGSPKADKTTVSTFVTALETSLDKAAAAHPNPGRPMMLHRLNRTEYLNTVRELFQADLSPRDAALLPADDTSFGFDNNGDVLGLSPLLLERYLSAANRVTATVLGPTTGKIEPDVHTHRVDYTVSQREWKEGLPLGTRGGTTFVFRAPVDGTYTTRVKLQRRTNTVMGLDNINPPQRLEVDVDGERVALFGFNTTETWRESPTATLDELLALPPRPERTLTRVERDQHSETADASLEVRLTLKAGERQISAAFLTRFEPVPQDIQQPLASGQGGPARLMGVDTIFVAGPFDAQGSPDTPSRRRVLTCQPTGPADETTCAKKILEPLARRAFRRPVTSGEMDQLLTAYGQGRKEGTFEAGIASGLRRLLMDPGFLFRLERDPPRVAPDTPYRISDLELASRLSFFLWSTIPDEPLLLAAERGQLSNPTVLDSQVKRMLADPRARNLAMNFGSQWLQLGVTEAVHPDPVIFTDFDTGLRQAFVKETQLLLDSVLLSDSSVLDLLNAKYTFVNERLASHYGIPGVYGDHFRRVEVTDGIRGGLLGQGSILTATAYPNRTSPVLRGKWILDTLLGSPPPPPPPNVPALPEAGEGAKVVSVRERLAEHRKNPACASCHARMDPLGFGLENFDATGKWRTVETNGPADLNPQKIDSSGELQDGTKFEGVAGLRKVLNERASEFVYTLTEKLLTFALGRGADWYDAPAIRAAVRSAQKDNYRFSALVTAIVNSPPFQMRMSQSPEEKVVALKGK